MLCLKNSTGLRVLRAQSTRRNAKDMTSGSRVASLTRGSEKFGIHPKKVWGPVEDFVLSKI